MTDMKQDAAVAVAAWASPEDVVNVLTSTDRDTFSTVLGALDDDTSGSLNRELIAAGIKVADRQVSGARLAKGVGYALLLHSGKVAAQDVARMAGTSEADVSQLKLAGQVVIELGLPSTITPAELVLAVGKRSKAIREELTSKKGIPAKSKAIAREVKVACDAKRLAAVQAKDKVAKAIAAQAKQDADESGETPETPDVPTVTVPELREQHVAQAIEALGTLESFLSAHGGLTENDFRRITAAIQGLAKFAPKKGGKLANS